MARRRGLTCKRVLVPFTGRAIPPQSIEDAVRLAKNENATIVPALLARVPRQLPIESPLPDLDTKAMPLLKAIEQRAAAEGIAVDRRIARGRTYRDALNHLLDREQFDHIVLPATDGTVNGLNGQDLAWLAQRAPAEITILRSPLDHTRPTTATRLGRAPLSHQP